MNQLLPHPLLDLAALPEPRRVFQAVTLFLDISGFTPLTEALMAQGKHGAETLAELVNDTFRPVITAIYAQGGYISGFAGDAVTAIFPLPSGDILPSPTGAHALAAAAHLQALFQSKIAHTPAGDFPLAAKIGLALGEMECGLVGEATRRAYYFRGPAIERCAQAEHHCAQGEIVLSAELQAQLQVASTSVGGGFVCLRAQVAALGTVTAHFPTVPLETALPFFPAAVLTSPSAGEFRQLVSVFVAFQALTPAALNTFAQTVLREVDARAGYFTYLDFGDKGGNCLILFGAPTAHENDLTRALQLALALHATYGDQVRCGLSVGPTYFGRVGIPERCAVTALGNSVNLAARLVAHAAWGQVLVSDRVAAHPGVCVHPAGRVGLQRFRRPHPDLSIRTRHQRGRTVLHHPLVGAGSRARSTLGGGHRRAARARCRVAHLR